MTAQNPTIHFLADITVMMSTSVTGDARLYRYGSELEVTDAIREASRDRLGNSWLDWLDTDATEFRRGQQVIVRRGAWPADVCRFRPGSFEWVDAREAAVKESFAFTDPQARAERRREIEAFYGATGSTSRTHAVIVPGPVQ